MNDRSSETPARLEIERGAAGGEGILAEGQLGRNDVRSLDAVHAVDCRIQRFPGHGLYPAPLLLGAEHQQRITMDSVEMHGERQVELRQPRQAESPWSTTPGDATRAAGSASSPAASGAGGRCSASGSPAPPPAPLRSSARAGQGQRPDRQQQEE